MLSLFTIFRKQKEPKYVIVHDKYGRSDVTNHPTNCVCWGCWSAKGYGNDLSKWKENRLKQ